MDFVQEYFHELFTFFILLPIIPMSLYSHLYYHSSDKFVYLIVMGNFIIDVEIAIKLLVKLNFKLRFKRLISLLLINLERMEPCILLHKQVQKFVISLLLVIITNQLKLI